VYPYPAQQQQQQQKIEKRGDGVNIFVENLENSVNLWNKCQNFHHKEFSGYHKTSRSFLQKI
jgi:hypothetical protein